MGTAGGTNGNANSGMNINVYNHGSWVSADSLNMQLLNSFQGADGASSNGSAQIYSLGYANCKGESDNLALPQNSWAPSSSQSGSYSLVNAINWSNALSVVGYAAGTAATVAVAVEASPFIVGGLLATTVVAVAANFGISASQYNKGQISAGQYAASGAMAALSLTSTLLAPEIGLFYRGFDVSYSVYGGVTSLHR